MIVETHESDGPDLNVLDKKGINTGAAALHAIIARHLRERADEVTVRQLLESRRQLREAYKLNDASRRLGIAGVFVRQRSDRGALLNGCGIWSDPEVLNALISRLTRAVAGVRMRPRKR